MRRAGLFAALGLLLAALPAPAQMTGHYVNGVEGLRAATLPPPGLYYRNYEAFYRAGRLTDGDGDSLPVGFDVDVWAQLHRVVYVSDSKILGANYCADAILPILTTNLSIAAAGINDSETALGDVWVEPFLLKWSTSRWDAAFGLGFFAPTGNFNPTEPASAGKGFWTGMATFGGTWYPDRQKSWSLSMLGRYEVHGRNDDIGITAGNDFHFEWGAGKQFLEFPKGPDGKPAGPPRAVWELGATGYAQWQLTDDSGPGITYDPTVHDSIFGVGPEVSLVLPSSRLIFNLRHVFEFGAVDRPEGSITSLVLTTWW